MTESSSPPLPPPSDATHRFSDRVADYVRYRPSYPSQAIDFLAWRCGLSVDSQIADIGSGTGIWTRCLLGLGCEVTGAEPNREMREAAEALLGGYPRFRSVDGRAEATGLGDGTVDLVTAAQAFHWFDPTTTRREFARILRPGGWVALVWNERCSDTTPFLRARVPAYRASAHRNWNVADLSDFFAPERMEAYTCANEQRLDLPALRGRLLSSSYTPKAGQAGHDELMRELDGLFERHGHGGSVCLEYRTEVYVGQLGGGMR